MRFPIELIRSRHLSRVAVIALVAGLAASCSDTSRFAQNPFSNPFTSSDNQLAYAQPQPSKARSRYDNSGYAVNTVPAAGVVASQPLPPVGAVAQRSTPSTQYRLARGEQPIVTGAISTPAPQIGGFKAGGWTATGGTPVTAAAGETINTLSNRYGVPSDAIMKVNGLTSRSLTPGQQVIIPVYNAAQNGNGAVTTVAATADQPYPGDVPETSRGSVGEVKVRPVATTPAAGSKPRLAPVAAASGIHVVKPGETLTSIAKAYGTTRPRLAKENGIDEWMSVKIGQKLVVRGTAHAAAAVPAPAAEAVDNRPPRDVPVAAAVQPRPVAAPKPVQAARAATPVPVKTAKTQKSIAAEAMQVAAPHGQAVKTATVKPVTVKPVQTAKVAPVDAKAKPTQVAAAKPIDPTKANKLKAEKLAAAKQKVPASKPAQVAAAKPVKPAEVSQPAPVATGTISPSASLPQQAAPAAELPKDANAAASGNPEFRWPVKGRIIQNFGRNSDGINISVPEGTEVKAAEDGVVAYAGNELKGYGNLILIRHANGYVTAYGHAKDLDVKKGETVRRGQTIATAGQTGNVTSPQVLFEVRKGAAPVDPTRYLSGT
ncbi:peptidoglycan DD-metalloendopeptidase family protein [Labrys neptuniae]|uniref:peptidoglycan DD-metalloendopeptidase family protein n=1 Tax=Labrys neptuniae TaxID=376174 RepID=UPI00288CD6EE|nr:peptidoglycan DD-metalloendopeptidase family protein [Labrys neptuniae]MDT3378042.1 peptidoglycan DD-metalloendopeptidase family protein [Labrys neptuniae]